MEKPKGHSQRPVSREAPKGVKGEGGCHLQVHRLWILILQNAYVYFDGDGEAWFFYQNERKYCISNGQWIDGFFLHIHLTPIKPMSDEDGLTSEKFYEDNAKDLRKVKY